MIRKSGVIILLVVAALVFAGAWFLRNGVLETLTEQNLEKVFSAPVDIDGVSVDLFTLTATFSRLAVADKDDLSQHMLEMGRGSIEVDFVPLLAKKLVINQLTIADMTTGSPRDTRGDSQPSVSQAPSEDPQQSGPSAMDSGLQSLKDNLPKIDLESLAKDLKVDKFINPQELASVKAIQQGKQEALEKYAKWEKRLDEQTLADDIKQLQSDIAELDLNKIKDTKDINQIKETLGKLKDLKKRAEAIKKQVKALQSEAKQDLKDTQLSASNIKELTQADIDSVKQLAKLADLNVEDIAKMLFGPSVIERFYQILEYYQIARGFLASDEAASEASDQAIKRRQGRDIHYAVTRPVLPNFVLRNAKFSGKQQDGMVFDGTLSGITSNARRYVDPAKLDVKMNADTGNWFINGIFDHRVNQQGTDNISFEGKQLSLDSIPLKASEGSGLPSQLLPKTTDVSASINIIDDALDGNIHFDAKDVSFVFPETSSTGNTQTLHNSLKQVFSKITDLDLTAKLEGSLSSPKLAVSSSVDKKVTAELKNMFGEKVKQTEQKIRKQIDSHVKENLQSVKSQLSGKDERIGKALDTLSGDASSVDEEIKKHEKALKAKLQEKLGAVKDKAQDKLQEKLMDKLPKLGF